MVNETNLVPRHLDQHLDQIYPRLSGRTSVDLTRRSPQSSELTASRSAPGPPAQDGGPSAQRARAKGQSTRFDFDANQLLAIARDQVDLRRFGMQALRQNSPALPSQVTRGEFFTDESKELSGEVVDSKRHPRRVSRDEETRANECCPSPITAAGPRPNR
ncbi:MAG: hypothetical protein ACI8TQ_000652 [Planctomycetota bacterium]|jgi:hypothetical protein